MKAVILRKKEAQRANVKVRHGLKKYCNAVMVKFSTLEAQDEQQAEN